MSECSLPGVVPMLVLCCDDCCSPVTRLDAEDDDDADGAIVGENGGNASAGKKSAEQPAQKATPSKESAANSVKEDDSPLTLSAGTEP